MRSSTIDLAYVEIVTSLGTIGLTLNRTAAPATAHNFLRYVEAGLLDGSSFYRIVAPANEIDIATKINVVQGGLSEDLPSPFAPIGHEPTCRTGLRHLDGTVSMARRELGSAAGAFFICLGDQPELDYGGARHPDGQGFAAFGKVWQGMDVVRAIWEMAEMQALITAPVPIISVVSRYVV
jgi:peptidyl-prolyl cis-trans isomerase A (cyclophilin A)